MKQCARPIPCHRQKNRENDIFIINTDIWKNTKDEKNCSLSLMAITVKKDKPVKSALDSKKFDDSLVKVRPLVLCVEAFLIQTSTKIAKTKEPL